MVRCTDKYHTSNAERTNRRPAVSCVAMPHQVKGVFMPLGKTVLKQNKKRSIFYSFSSCPRFRNNSFHRRACPLYRVPQVNMVSIKHKLMAKCIEKNMEKEMAHLPACTHLFSTLSFHFADRLPFSEGLGGVVEMTKKRVLSF